MTTEHVDEYLSGMKAREDNFVEHLKKQVRGTSSRVLALTVQMALIELIGEQRTKYIMDENSLSPYIEN